jgi:hypothetical protein
MAVGKDALDAPLARVARHGCFFVLNASLDL